MISAFPLVSMVGVLVVISVKSQSSHGCHEISCVIGFNDDSA